MPKFGGCMVMPAAKDRVDNKPLPVVILPGWGFRAMALEPYIHAIERQQPVYLLDDIMSQGCLESASEEASRAPLAYLKRCLPDKMYLCGWSLGGLLAMMFALQYPQRVAGLTTFASSPCFLQQSDWPGIPASTLAALSDAIAADAARAREQFLHLLLQGQSKKTHLLRHLRASTLPSPNAQHLLPGLHLLSNIDVRERLHDIICPQLHIWGRLDPLLPMAVYKRMSCLLPQGSCILLDEAGHLPFYSHAESCFQWTQRAILLIKARCI